jgi:Beta-lactamase
MRRSIVSSGSAEPSKVRILILKQTNEESKSIQSQLESLVSQLPEAVTCEIDKKTVKNTEIETSDMINQSNYDIVIVNEDVTLSAWNLPSSAQPNTPNAKPIYYLAGNVETILDREIKQTNFSGSVAINKDNKPLFRAAYGESNSFTRNQNTPLTQFNIASIVKMITAIGVVKLVEDTLKTKYGTDVDIYNIPIQKLLPPDFTNKERFRDFGSTGIAGKLIND